METVGAFEHQQNTNINIFFVFMNSFYIDISLTIKLQGGNRYKEKVPEPLGTMLSRHNFSNKNVIFLIAFSSSTHQDTRVLNTQYQRRCNTCIRNVRLSVGLFEHFPGGGVLNCRPGRAWSLT